MNTPFVYGRIADKENFTDREQEVKLLTQNFNSLVNTVIISPRRWGKTSLVHKVAKSISDEEKNAIICQVDIFNCRTEEEFYIVFANFLLKSTSTVWEEFVGYVTKIGADAPLEIECQDEMFMLKSAKRYSGYFKNGNVNDILKAVIHSQFSKN